MKNEEFDAESVNGGGEAAFAEVQVRNGPGLPLSLSLSLFALN